MDANHSPSHVFEFRCLGPVALTAPGGGKLAFRTRKQMALLMLLGMRPGRACAREQLLDLLWPDGAEERGRHSLSQSVSLINKTLGREAIAAAGKDQLLLHDGVVWLDVVAFERCVAEKRYREARKLWRGNLLEGLWIQRAPNFERWLDGERERLVRALRQVLRELVESSRVEGDWEAMRATAESLLDVDGLDEGAMLAYLEALTLLGDRTLALRRWRDFQTRLLDELEAEPGPELRDWLKRHRRGEGIAADLAAAQRAAAARVSETGSLPVGRPVFGRSAEYAALWQAWEAARAGRGAFTILEGAAGIGKTALAAKLVNQVHVAGGSVCFTKCFKSEKSVPFAPVSAMIRQLARLPGFVALGEIWIGELGRLVPELRERYPHAPQAMAIDDSARHRLCDAALRAAECVADEQTLLVVVDDIQDADDTTLALLHYFGRQVAAQRTLLLCVTRTPAEESEMQRAFFDTARSAGFARFLTLGALGDAEIARIVQQVLAQRGLDAPDGVLKRVGGIAHGNPLHAIEVALAIPGQGGRPAEDWLRGFDHEAAGGADSFERTSTERLGLLSEQARLVASALAIAGRPLSEYELAAVTELPTAELASAVFALEGAHFVRRSGASIAFVHEGYLASAQSVVLVGRRRELEARLARLLAKSAAGNPAARYEVARHFEGAGRPKEARAHALAAAKYASSVGAVRERADALALARRVTRGYDGKLAAELGACYLDLKEFDQLARLSAEARARPRLAGPLADDFRYLEIAADHHSGSIPLSGVKTALEDLLASSAAPFPHEMDAQNLLLRTADKTGDYATVRRIARDLRRRDRLSGSAHLSAHALFAAAYVIAKYYWPARALPLLERALERAQADHDWGLEHLCRDGIGAVLKQLGRYSESIQHIQYGLALARKTLNPHAEATSLINIAVAEMALGNFERAADRIARSAEIDERFPRWAFRAYRYVNHGELMLSIGDFESAAMHFQRAYDQSAAMDLWPVAVVACAGLALCAQRQGNLTGLGEACLRMDQLLVGRRTVLHDRWKVEAAAAWHAALNLGQTQSAITELERAAKELSRRDVDNWLCLELELLRVRELVHGKRASAERLRLVRLGQLYGAVAITAAAQA